MGNGKHRHRLGPGFSVRVHRAQDRPALEDSNATWSYDFDNLGGETRVNETWNDDRVKWLDWVAGIFDRVVTKGRTFADFQRLNIHKTLTTMKGDFEQRP